MEELVSSSPASASSCSICALSIVVLLPLWTLQHRTFGRDRGALDDRWDVGVRVIKGNVWHRPVGEGQLPQVVVVRAGVRVRAAIEWAGRDDEVATSAGWGAGRRGLPRMLGSKRTAVAVGQSRGLLPLLRGRFDPL